MGSGRSHQEGGAPSRLPHRHPCPLLLPLVRRSVPRMGDRAWPASCRSPWGPIGPVSTVLLAQPIAGPVLATARGKYLRFLVLGGELDALVQGCTLTEQAVDFLVQWAESQA